ncbi:MAG: hypothetical protein ACE5O2_04305 [Armatimonadota bacterium]
MCRLCRSVALSLGPLVAAALVARPAAAPPNSGGDGSPGIAMRPGEPPGIAEFAVFARVGRVAVPTPAERVAAVASQPGGEGLIRSAGAAPDRLETLAILSPNHLEAGRIARIVLLTGLACDGRHDMTWMTETDAVLQVPQGRSEDTLMWFWVRPPRAGWYIVTLHYSGGGLAVRGAVAVRHRDALVSRVDVGGSGDFCVPVLADFPLGGEPYWFRVTATCPVVFHRLVLDRVGR